MEEHGLSLNLGIVAGMWIPYFVLSHVDFVRLTRFSLKLEQKYNDDKANVKVNGKNKNQQGSSSSSANLQRSSAGSSPSVQAELSLFLASGVESIVAVVAFLPTTV
jgi:hypothetical protein